MLLDMRQKMPFFHHFVTTLWQEFKKKALPLHQQKRDCNKDNVKQETSHGGSTKKERKQIMMTTVMILTVVAAMIAKAVNVNNNMEMGK